MALRPRHKYNAKPTKRDGHHFPSKKEAGFYDQLVRLQAAGDVLFFLRQVPFHLPGGIKAVVDFVVFYTDGQVRIFDVKGVRTASFIRNKKQVEHYYPVEVEEV